eukprot:745965-Hanusia_phi.AAC.5
MASVRLARRIRLLLMPSSSLVKAWCNETLKSAKKTSNKSAAHKSQTSREGTDHLDPVDEVATAPAPDRFPSFAYTETHGSNFQPHSLCVTSAQCLPCGGRRRIGS